MTLAASIKIGFDVQYSVAKDLSTPADRLALSRTFDLADGSGANQAQVLFSDIRTLADGANEVLDLYASGSLLDNLGVALTLTRLKVLYLKNLSTDANLLVGGGTTPVGVFADASDILTLPPGGIFIYTAPNATGLLLTTNKNLKLEHNGTGTSTLSYEIIVIGID